MAEGRDPLSECIGFDWSDANTPKNWERHQVTPEEAEDVFFNELLIARSDLRHSKREKRYYALGQTASDWRLFVSFTIRHKLIRVISVRDINHKEQEIYDKHEKRDS